MKRLIPAVGYVRRSTHKQEKSLADQRREIEAYAAAHGYRIIRWYTDDGISGDATEKRRDFQRMHSDALNGRDFDAILCWDQDRFGRFDSMEAGYWVHPLRKAGVRLVTVTEGPIDWDGFTGRVVYGLKQEGKHQFLRDLAKNTARGQVTVALNGYLTGRAAPYGYDRMIVDEAGAPKLRVKNGDKYVKPRGWHVTLAPSDDPEKVRVAKWLFKQYASLDLGLRQLVNELNKRGVPGPRGGPWHVGTVRDILRNEDYTGRFVWPKRAMGKYVKVVGQEVRDRDPADAEKIVVNDPAARIVVEEAWEPLVDRKTFDRVQRKLTARRDRCTSHKKKNMDAYLLPGLVFCAHCGAKMTGSKTTRRKDGAVYSYPKYICSSYHTKGSHVCGCHSVDQGALLRVLLAKLREVVFCGGHREALRERVVARMEARAATDPAELDAMRGRLATSDAEIEQGARRLLRAPDDVADLLGRELSAMRRDRDRLISQVSELEGAAGPVDLAAEADAAVDRLWGLAEELEKAPLPG